MDRGWMEEWEQDGITGSKLTGVVRCFSGQVLEKHA